MTGSMTTSSVYTDNPLSSNAFINRVAVLVRDGREPVNHLQCRGNGTGTVINLAPPSDGGQGAGADDLPRAREAGDEHIHTQRQGIRQLN